MASSSQQSHRHEYVCRGRPADAAHRSGDPGRRSQQAPAAAAVERGPRRFPEMEGRVLPRPEPRSCAACRDGPPVRRADDRPCGVRPCRGLSRDLFGRQEPHRQRKPRSDDGDAVVRLAHRHHGGGQSALRLDPARRDDTALWRRHVLDQSCCCLQRVVADNARLRRRAARDSQVRAAAKTRRRAANTTNASSAGHWPASIRW